MPMTKERKPKPRPKRTREVPADYLQKAAYYHWEARGCPPDDSLTDWLAVEKEWHSFMEGVEKKEKSRKPTPVPIKVF